ncbi:MAG: hypothetical protein ACOX62_07840 [Christensenellales bacterium]
MNHLLAKVNNRDEQYRKIISDNTIFYNFPENLSNHHEYTPAYKLEDDEWYSVSNLSQKEFCIELIKSEFDSTPYKLLSQADPSNITYICAFQDETVYHFQRIFKYSVLERKKTIHLGDEITVKENPKQIILSDTADAIYVKSDDILYFRKLETIAPIFKGIDILYREATEDEVTNFLNQPFVRTDGDYSVGKVGKANRRRLAMALESFNKLTPKQKIVIFKYTNEYYPQLKYDGTAFTINNEDNMKYLLYGLEQRYYTTPATNEKLVANSVSNIPKK